MLALILSGYIPTQHSSNENLAGWLAGWSAGCLIKDYCQRFFSSASKSLCFNVAFINGQVKTNNVIEYKKENKKNESGDDGRNLFIL